nr:reverse transcriptase domain-containing protein [Tanacetum cinerariifolium]
DARNSRTRISKRVTMDSQRVDLLMEDRIAHQKTILIVEEEAYAVREAWAHSIRLSQAVHSELQTHREQAKIAELRETDRRRQAQVIETLRVMGDMRRDMGDIQIMAPVTRQGLNIPPNNTNPNNMTPESIQDMIDQALLRNSTNRDESHSSHGITEGMCKLRALIEKMELVFQISCCAIENQFVANEIKKIDKYISRLPDNIYGSVKSFKPKTLDETIELANDFIDQKLRTYAERQTNKRKADDLSRNNHGPQQQLAKGQNVSKLYSMGSGNSYDVKLADGKIVRVNTIMRGCTLNFLNHPFNIDLMRVELGSFDVIIGIDCLRRCHAVIVCDEKLVRVPYGNETLIFHGDESNDGKESRLTIISCSKAQEYMAKGCQIFLAEISAKKEEDKLEGKHLKDVPIV